MTESRNHHFVPQGYLRGFGWKRGKHHMVIVHDFKEQKTYKANTRNVCAQRDFMRFDFNDRAPDWLENELGKLESNAVTAIRDVASSGDFRGGNRNHILNLMAVLAVRSPEQRESMRDFHARVAERMLDLLLENKEDWEKHKRDMEQETVTHFGRLRGPLQMAPPCIRLLATKCVPSRHSLSCPIEADCRHSIL